jgi:hypothetical protein
MTKSDPDGELTRSERLDALIRLYTIELERQKQVESIQWRINFSVWTFIVLAAHALKQAGVQNHFWLLLGGATLAFLHYVAIVKNVRSVRASAQIGRHYRQLANALLGEQRLPALTDDVSTGFHSPQWWVAAIFGTTLLLIAVALAYF